MTDSGVIGVDLGTSACRALAVDESGAIRAESLAVLPEPECADPGGAEQAPECWWQAVLSVLQQLRAQWGSFTPRALAVDATSATLLLCHPDGVPLGNALLYRDGRARVQAERVAAVAPPDSPARGATASLAKLLFLKRRHAPITDTLALHQADWITGRLRGRYGVTDWNNALKLGFDPAAERWPAWLAALDLAPVRLPRCVAPGSELGLIDPAVAARLGVPPTLRIHAGTTDSTAAAIAAGVSAPGDAVTSLGSTLVLKIVAERPLNEPRQGIYSHRFGAYWLVGGASNSGGAVLRRFFSDEQLARLSAAIDPDRPSGLDYYPLPDIGERFPIVDPTLRPRMEPRPLSERHFLHGLLEGIAAIEADGYRRLVALGAPPPRRVLTIGGGAVNSTWTRMRARLLGVPVQVAPQAAAYGAACLALRGGI